jgi:putative PIN family toxin of toxin-antitoxin system
VKAVIDTNVFLAGLLNSNGGAARIIGRFRDGEFDLVISRAVFREYVDVIHVFDNAISAHKSEELLELVFERAVKVEPVATSGLCKDPDDEKFFEAALTGQADYIVTKNRKDFPRGLMTPQIVGVSAFLKALEQAKDRS